MRISISGDCEFGSYPHHSLIRHIFTLKDLPFDRALNGIGRTLELFMVALLLIFETVLTGVGHMVCSQTCIYF